jgi:hypothetical protein
MPMSALLSIFYHQFAMNSAWRRLNKTEILPASVQMSWKRKILMISFLLTFYVWICITFSSSNIFISWIPLFYSFISIYYFNAFEYMHFINLVYFKNLFESVLHANNLSKNSVINNLQLTIQYHCFYPTHLILLSISDSLKLFHADQLTNWPTDIVSHKADIITQWVNT